MVGEHSKPKEATTEIQTIIDNLKTEVETKLKIGSPLNSFEAVVFREQVVAGTVYHVKVKVSESEALHLRIYQPLPYTGEAPRLQNVVSVSLDEELGLLDEVYP